jgi:GntR family transcriptional regulator/MocR family aminotransferase
VLAEFIREGHFGRHVRKMRKVYEERRRLLVEEIERALGLEHRMIGAAAGMHVALLFGDRHRDRELTATAAQKKLWLSALSLSYAGAPVRQGVVLGFGNTPVEQIPAAIGLLKTLLGA